LEHHKIYTLVHFAARDSYLWLGYNPLHGTFYRLVNCKLKLLCTISNQYQHFLITLTQICVHFKLLACVIGT